MNIDNYGVATGHLGQDVTVFENKDGSRGISFSIATKRWDSNNKQNITDWVQIKDFIPADRFKERGLGVYKHFKKGAHVTVNYTVRQNVYEKDGKTVYENELRVVAPPRIRTFVSGTEEPISTLTAEELE